MAKHARRQWELSKQRGELEAKITQQQLSLSHVMAKLAALDIVRQQMVGALAQQHTDLALHDIRTKRESMVPRVHAARSSHRRMFELFSLWSYFVFRTQGINVIKHTPFDTYFLCWIEDKMTRGSQWKLQVDGSMTCGSECFNVLRDDPLNWRC